MRYSVINTCECGMIRLYDGTPCKNCERLASGRERYLRLVEARMNPYKDIELLSTLTLAEIHKLEIL